MSRTNAARKLIEDLDTDLENARRLSLNIVSHVFSITCWTCARV
jgi:hypothetical protein